jgi:hypothetical protein
MGKLQVTLIAARNLHGHDTFSKIDPFVRLQVGSKQFKSCTAKNTENAEYNETFTFVVANPKREKLSVTVLDQDAFSDDHVGWAEMPLNALPKGQALEQWLMIVDKKGVATGTVGLMLLAVDFGIAAAAVSSRTRAMPNAAPPAAQSQPCVSPSSAPDAPPAAPAASASTASPNSIASPFSPLLPPTADDLPRARETDVSRRPSSEHRPCAVPAIETLLHLSAASNTVREGLRLLVAAATLATPAATPQAQPNSARSSTAAGSDTILKGGVPAIETLLRAAPDPAKPHVGLNLLVAAATVASAASTPPARRRSIDSGVAESSSAVPAIETLLRIGSSSTSAHVGLYLLVSAAASTSPALRSAATTPQRRGSDASSSATCVPAIETLLRIGSGDDKAHIGLKLLLSAATAISPLQSAASTPETRRSSVASASSVVPAIETLLRIGSSYDKPHVGLNLLVSAAMLTSAAGQSAATTPQRRCSVVSSSPSSGVPAIETLLRIGSSNDKAHIGLNLLVSAAMLTSAAAQSAATTPQRRCSIVSSSPSSGVPAIETLLRIGSSNDKPHVGLNLMVSAAALNTPTAQSAATTPEKRRSSVATSSTCVPAIETLLRIGASNDKAHIGLNLLVSAATSTSPVQSATATPARRSRVASIAASSAPTTPDKKAPSADRPCIPDTSTDKLSSVEWLLRLASAAAREAGTEPKPYVGLSLLAASSSVPTPLSSLSRASTPRMTAAASSTTGSRRSLPFINELTGEDTRTAVAGIASQTLASPRPLRSGHAAPVAALTQRVSTPLPFVKGARPNASSPHAGAGAGASSSSALLFLPPRAATPGVSVSHHMATSSTTVRGATPTIEKSATMERKRANAEAKQTNAFWKSRLSLLKREVEKAQADLDVTRSRGDAMQVVAVVNESVAAQLELERQRNLFRQAERREAIRIQTLEHKVAMRQAQQKLLRQRFEIGAEQRKAREENRGEVQRRRDEESIAKAEQRQQVQLSKVHAMVSRVRAVAMRREEGRLAAEAQLHYIEESTAELETQTYGAIADASNLVGRIRQLKHLRAQAELGHGARRSLRSELYQEA